MDSESLGQKSEDGKVDHVADAADDAELEQLDPVLGLSRAEMDPKRELPAPIGGAGGGIEGALGPAKGRGWAGSPRPGSRGHLRLGLDRALDLGRARPRAVDTEVVQHQRGHVAQRPLLARFRHPRLEAAEDERT